MSSNLEIEKLRRDWKNQRKKSKYESTRKNHLESQAEYRNLEDRYYDLLKNSTILSGSIFASSIALVTGRSVGIFFILGELMLLFATIMGIIFLWNQLNVREWSHFLSTKGRLESELILYEDVMEEFEVKFIKEQIISYSDLLKRKSILSYLFKWIKPDWLPSMFYISLIIGLIMIWVSLL